MKTITKKCQPPYFEQILNGSKRFEIRLNHLEPKDVKGFSKPGEAEAYSGNLEQYEVGDTLDLKEWAQSIHRGKFSSNGDPGFYDETEWQYTGRAVACRITSVVALIFTTITRVFIDGHDWWTPEEIEEYGIVIMGIEVIK